jgi:DNA-3-methyladenine glycosylase I
MNKKRCRWCEGDTLYEDYHDKEWGVPLFDDRLLFEFLTLETFQAGLSWITVLRKREHFRKAFDSFNYQKIATYDAEKVATLLLNRGIIRNRLKIEATIKNAEAFMLVQKQYSSFSSYIWDFVSGKPIINQYKTLKQIPAHTPLAEKISKDLKQKGFKFVGPTVVYAHMQATGMVNDHLIDCHRHSEITLEG